MENCVKLKEFGIKPVGQHLVVKVIDDGELADGSGFVLAKNYHQKPMVGEVVELSEELDNDYLKLEVGSKVLLPKYGATGIKTEDGDFQLVHRKDIIGVI